MGRSRTSGQELLIKERRDRVVSMRKTGANLGLIAQAIANDPKFQSPKYCESQVHRDIKASLNELNEQCLMTTEEYRRLELERLDDLQFKLQSKLKIGDVGAVNAALKIGERRAKLLGLDAPFLVKVEETVDSELRSMMAQLQMYLPTSVYSQVLDALRLIDQRSVVAGDN